MTFNEKLTAAVAKAQTVKQEQTEASLSTLLTNEAFIEAKRSTAARGTELSKLNSIITQLNSINQVIAAKKYQVRVFPVANRTFGNGIAEVIGIISGVSGAFTAEMAAEYEAISGVPIIELQDAAMYLGSPAYATKDGRFVAAEPADYSKFMPLLVSISLALEITEFDVHRVTQDVIDIYFLRAEQKANKYIAEYKKAKDLDTDQFTLVD